MVPVHSMSTCSVVSPVTSVLFSLGMRAASHRRARSSRGLHYQFSPRLLLPPRWQGLDPALLPTATHWYSSSLAASWLTVPYPPLFQLTGAPEQITHLQSHVLPPLCLMTIVWAPRGTPYICLSSHNAATKSHCREPRTVPINCFLGFLPHTVALQEIHQSPAQSKGEKKTSKLRKDLTNITISSIIEAPRQPHRNLILKSPNTNLEKYLKRKNKLTPPSICKRRTRKCSPTGPPTASWWDSVH